MGRSDTRCGDPPAPRRARAAPRLAAMLLLPLLALAAAPAGAQTARALLPDLGQADAAMFVIEAYLNGENTLEDISSQYAQVVSYYDLGAQSIDTVLNDKAAYVRRWPQRAFFPDLNTLAVTVIEPDNIYSVAVEVDFDVSNDRASVAGRSLIEIVVRRAGEGFEIIGEGGRVISRR